MFNTKQQTAIRTGAAAVIVFMISLIAGMPFGAALVWGLICGAALLQLLRQNLYVAEGTDILHGVLHDVRTRAGVVHSE
ncbi:hypothetical protein [Tropicimonas sp. IMCC34043]|uniref:hypothetical protein n=1 Tax=Tropicimonas sp. IMCC34043 TaxID=2248760 RepID=UPI000E24C97B|nr:hypothetical protein [Tropicimonas sp. IMCC34043]